MRALAVDLSCFVLVALAATMPAAAAGGDLAQRGAEAAQRRDLVGRTFDARIVRVADGDTLEVMLPNESRPVRLRLEGIDAPELGEPFSREAHARLRSLVLNQHVRVTGRNLDTYGRLVARVVAADGDVSTALVRDGLACHAYAPDPTLAREESQARTRGAGFWAAAHKPQCVVRTAFSARTAPRRSPKPPAPPALKLPFHANVNSKLYHAPSCPNYNCRNCTRVFTTEAEARAAGFTPARDCINR